MTGTAGVTSAVTTPVPLGGNTPAVSNVQWLFAWHTCGCEVAGTLQLAECWNETPLPQRAWAEGSAPQKGMDAAPPAPRGLLCAQCLKIIWVHLIVSQLQHGSPQSCWKERSCWHYGWYLFRAAHCAWHRLHRGGCDECKTTYADGFNSWECVQLYKIHGEAEMLSTYMVPNTSKLVWKCQLIIFRYYYSQKAQCKYTYISASSKEL